MGAIHAGHVKSLCVIVVGIEGGWIMFYLIGRVSYRVIAPHAQNTTMSKYQNLAAGSSPDIFSEAAAVIDASKREGPRCVKFGWGYVGFSKNRYVHLIITNGRRLRILRRAAWSKICFLLICEVTRILAYLWEGSGSCVSYELDQFAGITMSALL